VADGVGGVGGQVHHLRRDGQQALAAGAQLHGPRGPLHERIAQVGAQGGEGARHGRLGHTEGPGGRLDRPEPGHQHERLELCERHATGP
jgi:hypothetical protein